MERAAVLFQGLHVAQTVVGNVLFPAGIVNANELVGERPASFVVFALRLAFLVLIIALGPRLSFAGTTGVFVKGLPAEFGATVAHLGRFGFPALFDDGSNPIKFSDFGGAGKAVALGAESAEQAWCQGRTGPRQAAEEGRVRMLVEGLRNGLVQIN